VGACLDYFCICNSKGFFSLLLLRMRTWNRIIWICLKFIQTKVKTVWKLLLCKNKRAAWLDWCESKTSTWSEFTSGLACTKEKNWKSLFDTQPCVETKMNSQTHKTAAKKSKINLIKLTQRMEFQPWIALKIELVFLCPTFRFTYGRTLVF